MSSIIAKAGGTAVEGDTVPIELDAGPFPGERLDRFLAKCLPQFSRTRLQRWIEQGAVRWDEQVLTRRHRLVGIELIQVEPQPSEAESAFGPEPVEFQVHHQDADILVIDKQAGLVVHPGSGNWHGTLLNGLLHRFPAQTAVPRAGIVHRLDKDTSGLLVVARSESAMASLGAQLADRSMGRRYLALVQGRVDDEGEIDQPIWRDPVVRTRMAVAPFGSGRVARTRYRLLATGSLGPRPVSLLECRLFTGRTHQIRVHLRHVGAPIVGDEAYGGAQNPICPRQALHAWRLGLKHPGTGAFIEWRSGLPDAMQALLQSAGIDLDAAMKRAERSFN